MWTKSGVPNELKLSDGPWRRKAQPRRKTSPPWPVRWSAWLGGGPGHAVAADHLGAGENRPALRQNTPALRQNTPALRQNTPALRRNTPALWQNTRVLRRNTRALRRNTPALWRNTRVLRQNKSTLRQNKRVLRQNKCALGWKRCHLHRQRARSPLTDPSSATAKKKQAKSRGAERRSLERVVRRGGYRGDSGWSGPARRSVLEAREPPTAGGMTGAAGGKGCPEPTMRRERQTRDESAPPRLGKAGGREACVVNRQDGSTAATPRETSTA